MLLVRLHIDLLKLKANKLFGNSDAELSWLLFLKKPTCSIRSYAEYSVLQLDCSILQYAIVTVRSFCAVCS